MKKLFLVLLVGLLAACSSNVNNKQEEVLDQNNEVIDKVVIDSSKQLSKDELINKLQTTYDIQIVDQDYYLYSDYDHNKTNELIVAKLDDAYKLNVYYISYDGKEHQVVLQSDRTYEGYSVSEIDLGNQKHLAINQYSELSMDKLTTIIALNNGTFEVLYQSNGAFITQENDDILFTVEAMDAMYDPSISGYIGHSYKQSYLLFDESSSSYKEYGAKEISADEFNQYSNAESIMDQIISEIASDDQQYQFKYFIRRNQIMHIQYEVGYEGGLINYGYYTLKIDGDQLEIISNASGQMKEHFSNLGVVY